MTQGAGAGVWTLPLESVVDISEGTYWLRFPSPERLTDPGVSAIRPGQFFMISPTLPSGVVYLGRPFSIGDIRPGVWCFLIRALGRGTSWFRSLPSGTPLRLVGPLGRPFRLAEEPVHRMVAGGIGLAPFFYLARCLKRERPESRVELFYGERTADAHALFEAEERQLFDRVERYTDDGSRGTAGTVVDGLRDVAGESNVAWYGCGPHPMLTALASVLEDHGVSGAQFSLEERMGCGFGACQACIVPNREGRSRYRLLCVDGPVVDPIEVEW